MISDDTVIDDNLDDDVSVILKAMANEDTWTSKKSVLREELVSLLKKRRYLAFVGSPYKYYAHRVGDSYLYDVPRYKQGWLKPFRGKRVRVVCVGSGRYKRDYMVGVVGITPKELIIEKLRHTYNFPGYVSSGEIVYKTRRFVVFKPNISLEVVTSEEPDGYLDLAEWSFVLVDGKDSRPKGKLKPNADGGYSCALLGWKGSYQESSLTDASRKLIDLIKKGRV